MKDINFMEHFERILWIDFETKSEEDLTKVGAHKYNSHESTKMILCSYAFDDEPVCVVEELTQELKDAIENPFILKIAHNAEFDMCVCFYVLGLDINFDDWIDTAYIAVYNGYPRALRALSIVLDTKRKGSQEGIELFSIPAVKAQDAPSDEWFAKPVNVRFNTKHTHPQQWEEFKRYAIGDVEVMRECFNKMALPPFIEIFTMHITFEMNFNGYPWDADLSRRIYAHAKFFEDEAGDEARLTYGIDNLRSTPQVLLALKREGIHLTTLNKKERTAEHPILDLRDRATGTSFAKLPTALSRLLPDGTIKGEFKAHGAHTGRWSAEGTQPQNFSRILDSELVNESLANIDTYDLLKQHVRLCIAPSKASKERFSCADLSQIEARIVAWLAGCKWRMEAFKNGEDIYARSAERMFNMPKVTKADKERQYGKNAELGFGYGGGTAAIKNIKYSFYMELGEYRVQGLVDAWRLANPEIVRLWGWLETAYREALRNGRATLTCGLTKLTFLYNGKDMKCILPSGRAIYYRGAGQTGDGYGSKIYYADYSYGERPVRKHFWGGSLLENVTQAIAKDVLVDIMFHVKLRFAALHMPVKIRGTVHDEVWYTHNESDDALTVLLDEMSQEREWAQGLVLKGDGFTSDRYRK